MKLTSNLAEIQEKNKRMDIINSLINEKESQIRKIDVIDHEELSIQMDKDKQLVKDLEVALKIKTLEETYNTKLQEYEELEKNENERIQKETKKIEDELSKLNEIFISEDQIKKMKASLDNIKRALNFIKEFDEEYESNPSSSDLKTYLEEYLGDLKEGLDENNKAEVKCVENLRKVNEDYINIQNRIKEIMDNISNIKKTSGCYKCPSCSQPFYIDSGSKKVIKLDDDPSQMKENLKSLEEALAKCNQDLTLKKQEVQKNEFKKKEIGSEISSIQQTIDQAKSIISQLSLSWSDDSLKILETNINENTKTKTKMDMLQSQLKKISTGGLQTQEQRVISLKQQLEQYKKEVTREHGSLSQDEIKIRLLELREKITIATQTIKTSIETKKKLDLMYEEIETLETELKDLQHQGVTDSTENIKQEIDQVKKDLEQAEEKEEKFIKREEKIKKYMHDLELYKQIDEKMSLVNHLTQEENLVVRGISKAETLLRKVNDAEAISLQNTIDNINIDVEEYIQNFFGENVTVKLASFKETNKGKETKPGISIVIMKDGEQVDIDSLSGGEYDRLALAFFLAFNKASKSSIIMLDESLSSIHAEMVEDIVMFVKEKLRDKLVLFTLHQCNTGLFDQMIDVEQYRI